MTFGGVEQEALRDADAREDAEPQQTATTDANETETLLAELAALSPIEYDRRRAKAADQLGVRVPTLDDEMKCRRRPTDGDNGAAGVVILLCDPEPCAEPVDGTGLLTAIREAYRRHLVLPEHADIALALWTVFTWVLDAFMVAPLLAVVSPEKRCGKTTLLHLLHALTPRALFASNITAAALFRAVECYRPTLIVDEADTFLRNSDELRGVLNAGHTRRSAVVIRTVGDEHEPRTFSVWCAKAIAMIGRLPDTLEDRSIAVSMKRRAPGEIVARLRLDRLTELESLGSQAARWAADHIDALRSADPAMPEELHDRAADNWRALLAIADAVGGTWPENARAAARTLSGVVDPTASARPAIVLLIDVREILDAEKSDHITTEGLLVELGKRDESPWPTWNRGKAITSRQIANLLRPFGVRSTQVHPENVKGYALKDLSDAFARYLPAQANVPNNPHPDEDLAPISDANGRGARSDRESETTQRNRGACSARSDGDAQQPELEV